MITIRIDMNDPIRYLIDALQDYIAEPEVAYAIFSLVLKSVLDPADTWVDNNNSFDEAVGYTNTFIGVEEQSQHICKIVEAKIFTIIMSFMPKFTSSNFHSGSFKYELKDDTQLFFTFPDGTCV